VNLTNLMLLIQMGSFVSTVRSMRESDCNIFTDDELMKMLESMLSTFGQPTSPGELAKAIDFALAKRRGT
jgi:hypothetical protein